MSTSVFVFSLKAAPPPFSIANNPRRPRRRFLSNRTLCFPFSLGLAAAFLIFALVPACPFSLPAPFAIPFQSPNPLENLFLAPASSLYPSANAASSYFRFRAFPPFLLFLAHAFCRHWPAPFPPASRFRIISLSHSYRAALYRLLPDPLPKPHPMLCRAAKIPALHIIAFPARPLADIARRFRVTPPKPSREISPYPRQTRFLAARFHVCPSFILLHRFGRLFAFAACLYRPSPPYIRLFVPSILLPMPPLIFVSWLSSSFPFVFAFSIYRAFHSPVFLR